MRRLCTMICGLVAAFSAVADPVVGLPSSFQALVEQRIAAYMQHGQRVDAEIQWTRFSGFVSDPRFSESVLDSLNVGEARFTTTPSDVSGQASFQSNVQSNLAWTALLAAHYNGQTGNTGLENYYRGGARVAYEGIIQNEVRALTAELVKSEAVTIDEGILVPFVRVWATVPNWIRSGVGQRLVDQLASESTVIRNGEAPQARSHLAHTLEHARTVRTTHLTVLAVFAAVDVLAIVLSVVGVNKPSEAPWVVVASVGIVAVLLSMFSKFWPDRPEWSKKGSFIPMRAEYRSYRAARESALRVLAAQTETTRKLFARVGCVIRLSP